MTTDARPDLLNWHDLLAPVGVERFFADYWQRRTLAFDLDSGDFSRIADEIGPLDIVRLAGLAQQGVYAWIANEYVAHSVVPVNASNAVKFFEAGATLYFVDIPIQRFTHGLATFLGAPHQKITAGLFLTPSSGGASRHFDANENFTIQLTGAKRWIVAETPAVPAATVAHVLGLQVPASLENQIGKIEDERNIVANLRPGTMLYVPRGTLHHTEAGEVSWSLNLSYSRATWLDLVRVGLQHRLAGSARWRGSVAGAGSACDPGSRGANILPELVAELRDMLAEPDALDRLCRDFLDQPDV